MTAGSGRHARRSISGRPQVRPARSSCRSGRDRPGPSCRTFRAQLAVMLMCTTHGRQRRQDCAAASPAVNSSTSASRGRRLQP
jgi:hypothetical protein